MKQDKIVELYRGELWECQLLESILIKESDTIKGTEILKQFRQNNQE